MREKYLIITNNPLVLETLGAGHNIIYKELSFEGILKEVRNQIHSGARLLSHPLSGSVKPNETPYKSVMITEKKGSVDPMSLELIEKALETAGKFLIKYDKYGPEVLVDFQLIDLTLVESAIVSAD